MGVRHKDGYSADVRGYFVVNSRRFRVAKSNGSTFVLAEPCELPPQTEGDLLVIIDDQARSRRVKIDGVAPGQSIVRYTVTAPF